jgi:hypothetical protein
MAQTNITFVSVIIKNPEDQNATIKRIDWLLKLIHAELPLVLYTCPFFYSLFQGHLEVSYKGLKIVPLDISGTEIFTHVRVAAEKRTIHLPQIRNTGKDTEFFCTLMNAKTELVARAVRDGHVPTPFAAFIDASIAKVLHAPEATFTALKSTVVSNKITSIVIPGCRAPFEMGGELYSKESILRQICWVFCGGFFIVPTGRAMEWHIRCRELFVEFLLEGGYLTWEVNLWAYLGQITRGLILWYSADHNDSMLRVPEYFQEAVAVPRANQ